jgi:hypothetical protein
MKILRSQTQVIRMYSVFMKQLLTSIPFRQSTTNPPTKIKLKYKLILSCCIQLLQSTVLKIKRSSPYLSPQRPSERVLHTVRSRASYFNLKRHLVSLSSSNRYLRLPPRFPVPSIFHEGIWGWGKSIAALILNLGTRCRWMAALTSKNSFVILKSN